MTTEALMKDIIELVDRLPIDNYFVAGLKCFLADPNKFTVQPVFVNGQRALALFYVHDGGLAPLFVSLAEDMLIEDVTRQTSLVVRLRISDKGLSIGSPCVHSSTTVN